jgi:Domain of unknown function (DUF4403)
VGVARSLTSRWITICLLGLIAVAGLGGAFWWWNLQSYKPPPQTRDSVELTSRSSSIVIPIIASLAEIQSKLNNSIPTTLYSVDEGLNGCVPAQRAKVCILPNIFTGGCSQWVVTDVTPAIDCHLSGQVSRRAIVVGGSGQNVALTMPVELSITAKGRGEIGKNIQATASGAFDTKATATFDIDENWRPSANVLANYNWTDLIHVWILGFKVTFADKVDPKLRDLIAQLRQKLPSLLSELKLKEIATQEWQKAFTSVKVADMPELWIRFSPENIGYGGYEIVDGSLHLTLMAAGKVTTFVGHKPEDPAPEPLPKLARNLPAPGFDFSLPISADYAALEEQVKRVLKIGQPQVFDIKNLGNVKVTFENVAIYQTTGKSLAIGLTLEADPPNRFFRTKGTIWLITRLTIDSDKRIISPQQMEIYSSTDNAPIDLLVSLVEFPPFNEELRRALRYDFSNQYRDMLAAANKSLRRQLTPDLYLDGRVESVTPGDVVAGSDALAAIINAHGIVTLHSGKLPQ